MTALAVMFAAAMLVVVSALAVAGWLLHDSSRRWVQASHQPARSHVRALPAPYDWTGE